MKIRRFRENDARQVSELVINTVKKVNSKEYPDFVIENAIREFTPENVLNLSKKKEIYVMVDQEKIIGTASLEKNVVYTVFVHPKCHKKGIGKKLMKYIEQKAKKNGVKILKVTSTTNAYEFYKKLGYEKVRVVHLKKYGTNIAMKKDL